MSSVPRIGSHPERPIVDVPHASKRLGQDLLLLNCWIKAKSVPELHLSQTGNLTCKANNNPRPTAKAVGFFPLFMNDFRALQKLSLPILLVFLISACASVEKDTSPPATSSPKPGTALIYFYRPRRLMGMAVGYNVRENNATVGGLPNGCYFTYDATPGVHTFTAATETTASVTVNVQAGKVYYIEGSLGMGAFVGHPYFTIVSDQQGANDVQGLKRVRLRHE